MGAADGVAEVVAGAARDDLGDQGVEVGVGGVAGVAVGVDADARPGGRAEAAQGAGGGADIAVRAHALKVDAGLDGEAAARGRLGEAEFGERRALGDAQLALHEIESGDLFGDGVLDLEAGVGFDEGEFAVGFVIDEEFEGAEVGVAAGGGEFDGVGADSLAQVAAERGAGGDFDQFLVAALDGAFALADVADCAVLVGGDLHFDVAGAGDEALDEERAVAEGGLGFAGAALEGVGDLVGVSNSAHAASAAAGDGLDHHWAAAQLVEESARAVEVDGVVAAGEDRRAAGGGEGAGAGFVAEQGERGGGGADEGDAGLFAGAGEVGVFGEEAVAGVDGVAVVLAGALDDLGDVEVGGGADSVERDLEVGVLDVLGGCVVVGVDGGGGDLEFGGGAEDADGDFAAVGDEQALDGVLVRHGGSLGPIPAWFASRDHGEPIGCRPELSVVRLEFINIRVGGGRQVDRVGRLEACAGGHARPDQGLGIQRDRVVEGDQFDAARIQEQIQNPAPDGRIERSDFALVGAERNLSDRDVGRDDLQFTRCGTRKAALEQFGVSGGGVEPIDEVVCVPVGAGNVRRHRMFLAPRRRPQATVRAPPGAPPSARATAGCR